MRLNVLVAVSQPWENALVTALERSAHIVVARRCADLAELLSAGASGLGGAALVSADLPALDRSALSELTGHGLGVIGICPPDDEAHERRLRQLGVAVVVPADSPLSMVEDAVAVACGGPGMMADLGRAAPVGGGLLDGPNAGDLSADAGEEPDDKPGRLVAVWGPNGAPGRSTLSLNVAAELARAGVSSLLVDADPYGGVQAQMLALLNEAPGLAAAVRASDHGALDLSALARLAPEVSPLLRILTGLPKAERWPELRAAPVEHVLTLARSLARVIVVDCGFSIEDDEELSYDTLAPRRNAATLTALSLADDIVVVGAGDPIGLQRLIRALQELAAAPRPGRRTVVVNKVRATAVGGRPGEKIGSALRRFGGVAQAHLIPDDRAALDGALLAGATLAEHAPSSPARTAVVELAAHLGGLPMDAGPVARRRPGGRRAVVMS